MRRLALALTLALAACDETPAAPLSYDRCAAGATCGIGTRCEEVTLSTTGAASMLCTAACVRDLECPGWSARCAPASDATRAGARCFHGCDADADCRRGTVCRPLRRSGVALDAGGADGGTGEVVGVCVPDFGPRACTRDEDCAPFALRCVGEDGGTTERACRAP